MSFLHSRHKDIWLCLFLIGLFILFPSLDLAFSDLFYNHDYWRWQYKDHPAVKFTYELMLVLPYLLVPLFLGMSIYTAISDKPCLRKQRKTWLFLLLALVLGPGLLVHEVFKQAYERPRPVATIEFAGDYPFTPAFHNSKECQNCNSFVSGHAAMGGFLLALVFVFREKNLLYIAFTFATVVGLGRIIEGGHYLSDVIFANYACYFLYRLLSYKLLGHSHLLETHPTQPP